MLSELANIIWINIQKTSAANLVTAGLSRSVLTADSVCVCVH